MFNRHDLDEFKLTRGHDSMLAQKTAYKKYFIIRGKCRRANKWRKSLKMLIVIDILVYDGKYVYTIISD